MQSTAIAQLIRTEIWCSASGDSSWELVEGVGTEREPASPVRPRDGILEAVASSGKPLITTEVAGETAQRLAGPGIGALCAIPVLDRGKVASICLLLVPEGDAGGALEFWSGDEAGHELSLNQGYYGELGRFGRISKHVHFPCGSGLPGRSWEHAAPLLMDDIGNALRFLRSSGANADGLQRAVALPQIDGTRLNGVSMLLATKDRPLFRAAEVWRPDGNGRLERISTCMSDTPALNAAAERMVIHPGEDLIGLAWSQRRAVLCGDFSNDNRSLRNDAAQVDELSALLAIPCFAGDDLRAVTLIAF